MPPSDAPSPNSTPDSALQQSELVGRKVLDLNTAEDLGQLQEIWVDPRYHQVLGFSCESGPLGIRRRYFAWTQLESLSDTAMMISQVAGVEPRKPKTAERVLSHDVWTDKGDRVGVVIDYRINQETGDVLDYLFTSDAWGGLASGTYALPAKTVISMNDARLIAPVEVLEAAEVYTGNVAQQAAEFLQNDFDRTRQDVGSVVSGAKAIAEHFTKRTKTLTDQGKQRLTEAVEQTKDQREAIAEQAQSKLQEVSEQLQQRRDQTQERFSETSRQWQDNATKLKGQLQDKTQKLSADARKRLNLPPQDDEPVEEISIEELENWDEEQP
ncbi:hypothetical protein [Vacuolonema iberomarrocanum]|uniref:PRC-barrel domain-containing protein n=1 Tax=Vacuolonema iberomarrocanum TaxID=3454632 RepID=UPI0019F3A946|nr:hypothetical protein [filamentous cyanobacterium LEGE 07170]